jgi:very-short-patch-repair endonuclease
MDRHTLRILAERQHGALRLQQLAALGFDDEAVVRMLRRKELERVGNLVVRLCGSPSTLHQRAWIAVLDAGGDGGISHHSAAALWTIPGFAPEPWHILRPRRKKDPEPYLAVVHETRRIPAHHLVLLDGVPVTTPARTLFDLASAAAVHPKRLERALDTAWAKGLVTPRSLDRMLGELAGRGRRGIALMRALLDARREDGRPPESGLEQRLQSILQNAGLTGFERQVVLGDEDEPIGRVDFVHLPAKVVLEVDSIRFHTAPLDAAADAARDHRLIAAGWTIVRITEFEVWHRPEQVVRRILAALRPAA